MEESHEGRKHKEGNGERYRGKTKDRSRTDGRGIYQGERFDRVGPETGRCVGKVGEDGNCASIGERSIPYHFSGDDVEKEPSYHRYEARQDFTKENMSRAIEESAFYTNEQKEDMKAVLEKYYKDNLEKYGEEDGLATGKIQKMFGKPRGGMQHDMPFSMEELKRLKRIKKVKV